MARTFRRRGVKKLACIVQMTTTAQVEKILYDIAAPLNINEAEFLELMDNSIVSGTVRTEWKFAAQLGIYSTPSYLCTPSARAFTSLLLF